MKGYKFAVLFLTTIAAASPVFAQTGYVSADLLNVRTAPSVNSEVTEMLEWGDAVTITYGPTMGWYEIYRNGGCYYVSADFVDGGSSESTSSWSDTSYTEDSSTWTDTSYTEDNSTWTDTSYTEDSSTWTDTSYTEDNSTWTDTSYTEDSSSWTETSYTEDSSSWTDTSYTENSGTYLGTFTLTAYCGCGICTGGSGVTASGTRPTAYHTVAMGGVPFGTQLLINGTVYTVEDRGTSYGHVDIYFDSHQDAVNFGVQYADVYQLN